MSMEDLMKGKGRVVDERNRVTTIINDPHLLHCRPPSTRLRAIMVPPFLAGETNHVKESRRPNLA